MTARPFLPVRPWATALCAVLCLSLLSTGGASAGEKATDGIIVPIPTPITTGTKEWLGSRLSGHLKRFKAEGSRAGGTFTVLCDFNPEGRVSECAEFGACYDLARYLRSLSGETKGVRTVAYVQGPVRKHSTLAVLACDEIVLAKKPDAGLGKVASSGHALSPTERTAYEEITRNRFPAVIIRKMYDPTVDVVKAGDRYADTNEKPRPKGSHVHGLGRGDTAFYTFEKAREVGLAQQVARDSIDEVRVVHGIPRGNILASADRSVCWHIPVEGTINGGLKDQLRRRLDRAIRHRANLIILELKCGDGATETAYEMGLSIANLNAERGEGAPENRIETIAYVTSRARNTAAFLAFACDKIVLQRSVREKDEEGQRQAMLGGFDRYLSGHPGVASLRKERASLERDPEASPERKKELDQQIAEALEDLEQTLAQNLANLAERKTHSPALAAALIRHDVNVHAVVSNQGGMTTYLSAADLEADQKGERRWRDLGPVTGEPGEEGGYLTVGPEKARELGITAYTVKDIGELFEVEGVSAASVRRAESDWLDTLADFLRDPWTSVILVMVGITCLILELKMPGVGLPGVIAAICFVLFFWAHSQFNGQIAWLGILLFVLGLILIGLEVFVIPGFGVCGISGIVLVLVSLGLVAYGHWPRSGEEWLGFGQKLSPFGISLLGSLVCVMLVLRYLPHIPILNRLMHKPVEETSEAAPAHPAHAELAALLGAIGVAATPLRPAGKCQFGDDFVDVVADGGYIVPGTRIQVIEVEGSRVVVKEI